MKHRARSAHDAPRLLLWLGAGIALLLAAAGARLAHVAGLRLARAQD